MKHYYLKVDPYHTIYIEEMGNPNGIPLIDLHGGPGWCSNNSLKYMNKQKYRIIGFHQRGCGKSKVKKNKKGILIRNKTKYIIQDIRKIKKFLNIKQKWIVTGGSWGSALALFYAIKYPNDIKRMVLVSIALFNSLIEQSSKTLAPDYYDEWKIRKTDKETLKVYFKELKKEFNSNKTTYTKKWRLFEDKCMFNMQRKIKLPTKINQKLKTLALLECYYYMNYGFYPKNYIAKHIYRIRKIPIIFIHGRFDGVTTLDSIYYLSKKLPKSKLIITNNGHGLDSKNKKEFYNALN